MTIDLPAYIDRDALAMEAALIVTRAAVGQLREQLGCSTQSALSGALQGIVELSVAESGVAFTAIWLELAARAVRVSQPVQLGVIEGGRA